MADLEGFILAGGASRRMGTDKARLRLGGQTFIARIADALAEIAHKTSVVVAQETEAVAAYGLPLVTDVYKGCGAFGGLHAALTYGREAPWLAVVSCDLPFVTRELFARLAGLRSAAFDAVVPAPADGRAPPLCALYARAACLPQAERLLRSGEFRPRVLLEQVRTRWVGPSELADLGDAPLFFTNVNTPEDYFNARRSLAAKNDEI